ncbi:MAG: hypothetical protein HOA95_05750 [Planctomycetes bacterium]|nr:hypothetical protein [Planctomycetota bacterium]
MAVTPTSGRRGLPIALLLLLLPAFMPVDLAWSQDPLPDRILESNHVWSGSFDSAMFGRSVADAGDVNGDGFSDIIVGAYGWDVPGGLFDEGAAFVFLGGPDGIVGTDPTTANAVLLGDQAGAQFGWSVAGAGDVNGDGFDDIIVGAPHYGSTIAGGTLAVEGAVFVFLGSPTGINATGPSTAHASILGTVLDSRLGHVVSAAGDVNNDGFGDIIVGMPRMGIPFACTQTNPPTCSIPENDYQGNGGAALIFLGSPEGITGTSIDDADSVIRSHPPGQPAVSGDQVGAGVAAAGDVNNDGFSDVLVGASGYIMVFHGSAGGIIGTDPGTAQTMIASDATVAIGALVSSAGDVNGDGFDDILASDPGYPGGVTSNGHGAFMVFHGGASGVTASSPADAETFIEGDLPPVFLGPLQLLGWHLAAAGDVDGDGFGEVLIGGLAFPGSLVQEGTAYLFSGGPGGLVGTTLADAQVQFTTGQANAAYRSNKPGFDVAGIGDVNGDGVPDLAMGAAHYDQGELNEGVVFVFHGGSGAPPVNQPPVANAGADQSTTDFDGDGVELITLDGSGSSDSDGTILSHQWSDGASAIGSGATLDFSFGVGDTVVTLVVTDDGGLESTDTTVVSIAAQPPSADFLRADCNADGGVDVSDPILLLERLFGAATAPDCEDSCDANDDGNLDLADVIAMLDHVFINGAALPEPASACGPDPVSDALTCSATLSCP